ncbi:hypothetical protein BS78_05G245900 [Paspalum vaginatum]|nr:hypothetical protein BS78_05G245900 [Paspalum vaginatum]
MNQANPVSIYCFSAAASFCRALLKDRRSLMLDSTPVSVGQLVEEILRLAAPATALRDDLSVGIIFGFSTSSSALAPFQFDNAHVSFISVGRRDKAQQVLTIFQLLCFGSSLRDQGVYFALGGSTLVSCSLT